MFDNWFFCQHIYRIISKPGFVIQVLNSTNCKCNHQFHGFFGKQLSESQKVFLLSESSLLDFLTHQVTLQYGYKWEWMSKEGISYFSDLRPIRNSKIIEAAVHFQLTSIFKFKLWSIDQLWIQFKFKLWSSNTIQLFSYFIKYLTYKDYSKYLHKGFKVNCKFFIYSSIKKQ